MTREPRQGVIRGMTVASAIAVGLSLAACVSAQLTLEDIALDPDSNRLAVSRLEDGLLTVGVDVGSEETVPFILDTGATKSVIFENRLEALDTQATGAVRVHGMFGVGVVPEVSLPRLALGTDTVEHFEFAVLPQRKTDRTEGEPWGILGMDVLSRYRLFSPGKGEGLILIEAKGAPPIVPAYWGRVELRDSPYDGQQSRLRFMDVRLNGRVTSALLDTGSAVNVLTYEFADFPTVRRVAARHRMEMEVEGAITSEAPKLLLKDVDFRAGSRVWWDKEFIVRDVKALEALGVVGQPFMIAGVDILADETFYLDLAGNELRMPKARRPDAITHSVPGAELRVGPEAHSR